MGNHQSAIDRVLKVLDVDKDGNISVSEIKAWLRDEQFFDNRIFEKPEIKARLQQLMVSLSVSLFFRVSLPDGVTTLLTWMIFLSMCVCE